MHVGIAGEVRCVVTKVDGEVKIDTGFQKNLILNQGLDFFGGGKGSDINASCAIGSGNSAPATNQTKLDSFIALTSGTDTTSDYSYVDKGDGLYRIWEQRKYRFAGLDNVNISEVGLVSTGTTSENYYLTTRALIKDSAGAPTSISVKTGETLDIYYRIHKVIDTRDKLFVVNMLDGDGRSVPYNVVTRSMMVGSSDYHSVVKPSNIDRNYLRVTEAELAAVTSRPTLGIFYEGKLSLGAYTPTSFKRLLTISLGLNDANLPIRSLGLGIQGAAYNSFPFMPFQIRFGSVADDSPIPKTNKDILTIPLEFSWGRYEGTL